MPIAHRAVQGAHALDCFSIEYSDIHKTWHNQSQHLAIVSVKDRESLFALIAKLESKGINITIFREPDMGNDTTAIAVEPTERAKKALSNLPLAFQNYYKRQPLNSVRSENLLVGTTVGVLSDVEG